MVIERNCVKLRKALTERDIAPDAFINIGVGNANTEAKLVKSYWPDIHILGIEPNVSRFKRIKKGFPGKLLNIAVSDKREKLKLFGKDFDQPSSVFPMYNGNNSYTVAARPLDDIIDEHCPSSNKILVWADIDGAELLMLQGCPRHIKNGRIIAFYLEVWGRPPKKIVDGSWVLEKQIDEYLFKREFSDKVPIVRGRSFDFGDALYIRK